MAKETAREKYLKALADAKQYAQEAEAETATLIGEKFTDIVNLIQEVGKPDFLSQAAFAPVLKSLKLQFIDATQVSQPAKQSTDSSKRTKSSTGKSWGSLIVDAVKAGGKHGLTRAEIFQAIADAEPDANKPNKGSINSNISHFKDSVLVEKDGRFTLK